LADLEFLYSVLHYLILLVVQSTVKLVLNKDPTMLFTMTWKTKIF